MSTDQEASETNGQQAPSANTNNPPAGNPPAGNSPAGNPPAGVPPPKWTRFAPRTPTNPVARPSSERGGDRRDGHGGHGGRRPQRPQKHHQRGGGGLPPRGMMMKPSGPLGMSDDYDMPASATPVCQPQGARDRMKRRPCRSRWFPAGRAATSTSRPFARTCRIFI